MLELKRPLNGLKKFNYQFQDISDNANNTFKVTDLPDSFLLGKNSFKLHLKEDVLVSNSQVYIDIIDNFGNSIYYKVISDNLPNKERVIAVYVYDTTPVGDCEIIIAGRLLKDPRNDNPIPYSNDPSSPDYHGIPNVAWRTVVQINPEEVVNEIYYSIPPTVTYSEIRKPQYEINLNNRKVNTFSTSSALATMYSNRGNMTAVTDVERKVGDFSGHLITNGSSSATLIPSTPVNNDNEISSLYISGFHLSSSMEGGRIYFPNIPYTYPKNAVVTESKTLSYSGSIVKVIDKNTCYVTPPFYQILNYTDNLGIPRKQVLEGFIEVRNFTASYYAEPLITENSASYSSFIKLEIENAEPDIGSVKSVKVKGKSINKPGQPFDLGVYDISRKNILLVGSGSYTMTSKGLEPLSLGTLRKLGDPALYWTGSDNTGGDFEFSQDDSITDGVLFPNRSLYETYNDFTEFYLLPQYLPTIRKGTEYELSFDLYYFDVPNLYIPRQLDVYISGSKIETVSQIQDSTAFQPSKNGKFGTYIGSVNDQITKLHKTTFYFKALETGRVTPRFVHRSTGAVYANIELAVRNKPGYSPNFIDIEVPLPDEFNSRSELSIEVKYYNARDDRANHSSGLYGVVFEGNTPTTGSSSGSTTLPSGLISGSEQLTSSYDTRYERKGSNIISSSQQIGPTGIYSASGQVPRDTIVSSSNLKIETNQNGDNFIAGLRFESKFNAAVNKFDEYSGSFSLYLGREFSPIITYITGTDEEKLITFGSNSSGSSGIDSNYIEIGPGAGTIKTISANGEQAYLTFDPILGFTFTDGFVNPLGLKYAGDYTATLLGNLRSFTDVDTVRKMFKSASLFSSSAQIKTALPTGVASGSDQFTSSYDIRYERKGSGIVSSSQQINNLIPNIVSSSTQVKALLPTGVVSGSEQLTSSYDIRYERKGTGIVSSSQQVQVLLPSGLLSSSNQIATEISGAYSSTSSSLAGRIATFENKTLYSSSFQVDYNQVTNKPVLANVGADRLITSDGTISGSIANDRLTYTSSSRLNRLRLGNAVEFERGYSSSFWTTEWNWTTQSIHTVNSISTNVFIDIPLLYTNDINTPITSSVFNGSYAVEIQMHLYGITGSLSSPLDTYNWSSTTQARLLVNPKDSTLVSSVVSVSSSAFNGLGGYGNTYSEKTDLNSWHSILGVVSAGNGNITLRARLQTTSSFNWTVYAGTFVKGVKHEIRI